MSNLQQVAWGLVASVLFVVCALPRCVSTGPVAVRLTAMLTMSDVNVNQ